MIDISKIRKNTKLAIDNAENIIAKKRKQIEGIIDKEILKASDSKQYETSFYYGQLFADLFKKDEVKDFNDIKRYISDVIVPAYEKEGYSITLSDIYVNNPRYECMTISWKETEKTEPIDLGTVELFTDEDRDKLSVIYWMSHSDNLFSEGTKIPRNCDICVNRKECVLRYLGDWSLPQKYCRFYEKD